MAAPLTDRRGHAMVTRQLLAFPLVAVLLQLQHHDDAQCGAGDMTITCNMRETVQSIDSRRPERMKE